MLFISFFTFYDDIHFLWYVCQIIFPFSWLPAKFFCCFPIIVCLSVRPSIRLSALFMLFSFVVSTFLLRHCFGFNQMFFFLLLIFWVLQSIFICLFILISMQILEIPLNHFFYFHIYSVFLCTPKNMVLTRLLFLFYNNSLVFKFYFLYKISYSFKFFHSWMCLLGNGLECFILFSFLTHTPSILC